MVDVGLFASELHTSLYEARHGEEALLVWVDAFFELDDVLFGGEEPSGANELGWVGGRVPI